MYIYTVDYLAISKGNPVICDNTDGASGYYAKLERQIPYHLLCEIKNKIKIQACITENILVGAKGRGVGVGELGGGGQKVHTSGRKYPGCNTQHDDDS